MAQQISRFLEDINTLRECLRQIQALAEVVRNNYVAALNLRGDLCEYLMQRLQRHDGLLDPIIDNLARASADLLAAVEPEYATTPLEELLARAVNWDRACFINRLSGEVEAHDSHLRATLSFASDATIRQINRWASTGQNNFTGFRQPLDPVINIPDYHDHPSFRSCRCPDCRTGHSFAADKGYAFTPEPSPRSLRRTGIDDMAGISRGHPPAENAPVAGPSGKSTGPPAENAPVAGPSGKSTGPPAENEPRRRMQVAKKSTGGKLQRVAVENVTPRVVRGEAAGNDDSNDSSILCLDEVEVLNSTIELSSGADSDDEEAMEDQAQEVNQDAEEDMVSLESGEEADVVNFDGSVTNVSK